MKGDKTKQAVDAGECPRCGEPFEYPNEYFCQSCEAFYCPFCGETDPIAGDGCEHFVMGYSESASLYEDLQGRDEGLLAEFERDLEEEELDCVAGLTDEVRREHFGPMGVVGYDLDLRDLLGAVASTKRAYCDGSAYFILYYSEDGGDAVWTRLLPLVRQQADGRHWLATMAVPATENDIES